MLFISFSIVFNLYFTICTLQRISYLILARKWYKFLNLWQNIDLIFNDAQIYDNKVSSMRKKLDISFCIFIIIYVASLCLIYVQTFFELNAVCAGEQDYSTMELIHRSTFPELYFLFGYNIVLGFIIMILFGNLLFTRMFNDYFIIIISKLLSRKFEVFNEKLSMNISVSFCELFFILSTFYPPNSP